MVKAARSAPAHASRRQVRKWTVDEDNAMLALVREYGTKHCESSSISTV